MKLNITIITNFDLTTIKIISILKNEKKNYDLDVLQNIIKKLRDPIYGCPWDKKQTIETIAPLTIEESYELAEAITKK